MEPSERIHLCQLIRDCRGEGSHPATFLYQFEAAGENLFVVSKLPIGLSHSLRLGIPFIRLTATPIAILLCAGLYSDDSQIFCSLIAYVCGWSCRTSLNAESGLCQVPETLLGS